MARLVLALVCVVAFPCATAQGSALRADLASVIELDGPAVRAMLARASEAEAAQDHPADLELAAALYCRAARYGSIEGLYRLGRMVMAGRGLPRDVPMASTLFSIAAGNGHAAAAGMVLVTGVHEEKLPPCLAEPPS